MLRYVEACFLIPFVLMVATSRVWTSETIAALNRAESEFGVLLAGFAVELVRLPRTESRRGGTART